MIPLRDENPIRRFPVVTVLLIAANVTAYLWELVLVHAGYADIVLGWGLVPGRLLRDPVAGLPTVLTSMFLHAPESWWHLGGNMLFLWVFGDNVEDVLGRWRFLGFYILSGTAAALAQIATDPFSMVPMIGASGAIAGVMAAYGALYPRAPVVVLNPVLPLWLLFGPFFRLPAWVLVLEFLLFNVLHGLSSLGVPSNGGVAFFAHLGGFLAGYLLIRVSQGIRRVRARPPSEPWDGWQPPPRVRVSDDPDFRHRIVVYPGRRRRWRS